MPWYIMTEQWSLWPGYRKGLTAPWPSEYSCSAGSVARLPWAYTQVLPIFHAHLHQVWCHKTPAAHHVEQGPGFAPHDPQHGIPQAEQVQSAFAILGRLNFSYRKARRESPNSGIVQRTPAQGSWEIKAMFLDSKMVSNAHQGRREPSTQNQKGGLLTRTKTHPWFNTVSTEKEARHSGLNSNAEELDPFSSCIGIGQGFPSIPHWSHV